MQKELNSGKSRSVLTAAGMMLVLRSPTYWQTRVECNVADRNGSADLNLVLSQDL